MIFTGEAACPAITTVYKPCVPVRLDCERVRPAEQKRSDKFSWNLYWQMKRFGGLVRFYAVGWNTLTGAIPILDATQPPAIWMAHEVVPDGDGTSSLITGGDVRRIMSLGRRGISAACFPTPVEYADITEWFWREYQNKGRCIVLGDLSHNWIAINRNARKCRHCGTHQQREVKSVRRIERLELWR